MSSLLTEDTGRSSQLFSASRARADSAPDKSISALMAQDCCEVNMTSIDLQEMITQRKDVVYMTFVLDTGCSTTLSSTTILERAATGGWTSGDSGHRGSREYDRDCC